MDPVKTGKVIAEMRKANCLTQVALAKQLGVSDKAVSKWERGLSFPDITVLIPLSEILGVSLESLLKGEIMNKFEPEVTLNEQNYTDYNSLLRNTIIHYAEAASKNNKKERIKYAISCLIVILLAGAILLYDNHRSLQSMVDSELLSMNQKSISYYLNLDNDGDFYTDYNSELASNLLMDAFYGIVSINTDKQFDFEDNELNMTYVQDYDKVVKTYGTESTVKQLMLYDALVSFIATDIDAINFGFSDSTVTIMRSSLSAVLELEDYQQLKSDDSFDAAKAKLLSLSSVDTDFAKVAVISNSSDVAK